MATANENNVTLREGLGAPLDRSQMDTNFQELKYVISDYRGHESASDPHTQYFNTSRLDSYINQATIRNLDWSMVSSNDTISDREGFLANTSGGPITVTLPPNPSDQITVAFSDPYGDWGTNELTVDGNGRDIVVNGEQTLVCDINHFSFGLVYVSSENRWFIFQ